LRTKIRLQRSIRAISPVISVLLMIAIAVAAALVAYAWVMGYMGSTTTKVGKAVLIQSMAKNADDDRLIVYVQNVGQGPVTINSVYVNDELKSFTTDKIDNKLDEGKTATVTIDYVVAPGEQVKVKVVTTEGTFTEGTNANLNIGGGGSIPVAHTLTVTVPSGGGDVTKDPDQASYADGTHVTLEAVPDDGWSFHEWGDDLSGSVNPTTITMDGDKTVTATFTQNEYSITVTVNPSSAAGSVSADISPPYHYNDVVTLTPTANPGYAFDHWSGDGGAGTGNEWVVTVTDNMDVTAHFTVVRLPIYVSTNTPTHDIPNVGSHSSFPNMQNDGSYDTLTEANVGGAESWESPTGYTSGSWDHESNAYDGNTGTASSYDINDDSWSPWLELNYASTTGTKIRYFVGIEDTNINNMQIEVHDTTSSWQSVYSGTPTVNQWVNVTFASRTTDGIRFRFYNNHHDRHRFAYVYEAEVLSVAPPNYQLDLEVQFSGVTDYSHYTQLEINTGTLDTENLAVYYWDGSWQLLTTTPLAQNTVNTFTVTLSGPTFDLRFIDTTRTGDTTPSSWQIDYVRLVAP
jgi:FlaG/FlaF family flagellin (archaellin)